MKGFGSDNHAGVHPALLNALVECNSGHAPSYGTDEYSELAIKAFKGHFGSQTEVFFVFNGTAANVLSLRFLTERHESVLCSDVSHLNIDECGAPEFFAGKLIPLKTTQGKISLTELKESLIRKGDQHYSQSRVISLTQPTELGTCYSLAELKEITDWAHQNQLHVHIDGARLTNALIKLKCTFKEMTTDLGIDVVSFGGTKNALMMGEAILVLNPELAKISRQKLKYIRKQAAQLPSKTRYIAAQFSKYLQNNLYLEIAGHSCAMAQRLYDGLKNISGIKITMPRESNAVFAIIPKEWIKQIKEKYFFYVWDEKNLECRIMTSWDSTPNEVDDFIQQLALISKN
ncbi:MAG: low specificity L-threonine aldolase [Bdellovibrionota bacterium]